MSAQPHDDEKPPALTPGSPSVGPAVYHGVLGRIALRCASRSEADPVAVYATLLGACGAWLGPKPHITVQGTRHPLLIWPLLMGPTGSGRKGSALTHAQNYLRPAADGIEDITSSGLSSGEGLIARIADVTETNSLPSKDAPAGTDDKRLWVEETEFASLMARASRDGSTLAAVLRQAWDGGALRVLTKASVTASSSHIGVTGHITPKEFISRMSKIDLAGGTFNRFLPIFTQRVTLDDRLDLEEDPQHPVLVAELRSALVAAGQVTRIRVRPDAQLLWRSIYSRLADLDENERWVEFSQRAAPYILRIACLLAILDSRATWTGSRWDTDVVDTVGAEHLTAAAALVDYSMDTARYVMGPAEMDPDYARVLRAVVQRGEMTRTDIGRMFSPDKRARVLDGLLVQMQGDPRLSVTTETTSGRSRVIVRSVLPALNATNATGDGPEPGATNATNATATGHDEGSEGVEEEEMGLTNSPVQSIARALPFSTPSSDLPSLTVAPDLSVKRRVAFVAPGPHAVDDPAWTARFADEPEPIDYEESP